MAKFQYLNIWGVFCNPNGNSGVTSASPGECYWYTNFPKNKVGIILHLGAVLPAGFLAVFQFVPIIRYKVILYHRIAGYVILLLVAVAHAGAIMIADHAFGGDVVTQVLVGMLVICTTIALVLAIVNIKRLQIDQHRAWMLRAWFWLSSIITLRFVMIIAASIQAVWPAAQRYVAYPCAEMLFAYQNNASQLYNAFPACNPANAQWAPDGYVVVKGDLNGNSPMTAAAALGLNFGTAGFVAWILHAVGVEIYLRLTPRESERLRQVSYERQLERGFANPGSAGLVVERFGDAEPWVPKGRPTDKLQQHGSGTSGMELGVPVGGVQS